MSKVKTALRRAAEETFGWAELRPEQVEAIEAIVRGEDVIAVLPTGAGKSAIYQVAALLVDGPAVVVSPLIALQQDQIDGLTATSAPRAAAINSHQRAAEQKATWEAFRRGDIGYLFLSPEQLAKDEVVRDLADVGVGLLAIDEAHCVSAWGHDFRPDYLRLGDVVARLGHPPVVALTATAAPPVRDDICRRLGLREPHAVFTSFDRPNLHLSVEHYADGAERHLGVVTRVLDIVEREGETSRPVGLVYTSSRKDAEMYAHELTSLRVRAAAYHAGMRADERERVHEDFLSGELEVVVATSAFGMGIDKPDVRFVVHAATPESLDSYYQHVGRGGRDGEPAEVILFHCAADLHVQRFLTAARAPEDVLRSVAKALRGASRPMRASDLRRAVEAPAARRTRAVNLLEHAGAVVTDIRGRLLWADQTLTVAKAVAAAVEVAETHQRLIHSRIEMIRGYADTTGCRRQFLLGYFGEQLAGPCGGCDTCDSRSLRLLPAHGEALYDDGPGDNEVSDNGRGDHGRGDNAFSDNAFSENEPGDDGPYPVNTPVHHVEWGHGVVMSVESDRFTVLFEQVGYKTLARAAVEEQELLHVVPELPSA